jgi:hypothetical protein
VPLNVLWRVSVNGADRTTTADPNELGQYYSPPSPTKLVEGAYAYVPSTSNADRTALNRFVASSVPDHEDCVCSALSGYTPQGTVGYPWTTSGSANGLVALSNGHSGPDYATYNASHPLAGYATDSSLGFGYRRYADDEYTTPPDGYPLVPLSLSSGGVTVTSNLAAGGSIWTWTDADGTQYVNHRDYGREIQASVFFFDSVHNAEANPDEAGDAYTVPQVPLAARHGSPLLSASTSGTTQSTRAIPLEWAPENFGGGARPPGWTWDDWQENPHPVVWQQMVIGKDVSLNFDNLGPVAEYDTVVTTPVSISGPGLYVEIPSAYLNRSQFKTFWSYEPGSFAPKPMLPDGAGTGPRDVFVPSSGYGGVIISDTTGAHALGLYGVTSAQLGSVDEFVIFDPGSNDDWTKFRAGSTHPLSAGTTTFHSWLVSGTLQNVTAKMDALKALGVR